MKRTIGQIIAEATRRGGEGEEIAELVERATTAIDSLAQYVDYGSGFQGKAGQAFDAISKVAGDLSTGSRKLNKAMKDLRDALDEGK